MERDRAIRLIDRVSAGVRDRALHGRLVLVGSAGLAAVRGEFGNAGTNHQRGIAPVGVEDKETAWIGTAGFNLATVRESRDRGSERPASDELLLEGFLLADSAVRKSSDTQRRDSGDS